MKVKLNKKYTIAWIAWIFIFFVIEAFAIVDKKKGDTLSEHFWFAFDIKDTGKPRKIMRLVGSGFIMWLAVHLVTGGWM